jgi:hypothetical protein
MGQNESKTYRVEIRIVSLVEADDEQGAISQAWYDAWDSGGASNLPDRSAAEAKEAGVTEEEWGAYCEGEGLPRLNVPRQ